MAGEYHEHERYLYTSELKSFLFDVDSPGQRPNPEVAELLTGDNLVAFLTDHRDTYCEDETDVLRAIQQFALHARVEFQEATTPEEDLSKHATRAEAEVSSFIETRAPIRSLDMLSLEELYQLAEIYNPNNLLHLAKLMSSEHGTNLSPVQGDMLFRYRSVIAQIDKHIGDIRATQTREAGESLGTTIVGRRTWAGHYRPYGHDMNGRIDDADFRDFSEGDDDGHTVVTVQGVPVDVSIRNTGVI